MKRLIILLLVVFNALTFGCATPMYNVEFAYFSKPQNNRSGIKDVFFNDSHSAYKKYRVNPDEELKEGEKPVFSGEKLPNNHHPVEDEFMFALVRALDKMDFFEFGRSVESFKQAIQIYKSKDFIRQCVVLIVDGSVTIAIPPKSPGISISRSAIDVFNKEMKKFQDYGKVYISFAQEFRRADVKTDSDFELFMRELERSHALGEEERRNIAENRETRERTHGN